MTYTITTPCLDVQDQACVEVCPVDCIHFDEGKDRMLYINPDECIDCGACEPACPVTAIFAEDDVPADQAPFKEINVLWFSGQGEGSGTLAGLSANPSHILEAALKWAALPCASNEPSAEPAALRVICVGLRSASIDEMNGVYSP
jgi:NAD-dependent dihydropyrimidine dehydrogenase PreA subunit